MSSSIRSKIHKTAVIYPGVEIGQNVYIGPGCIIGAPGEHKGHWNKRQKYSVIIKDNAVIHGNVAIDAGTENDTVIGEGTWLMKGAYIAHDVLIGDEVTICANVNIAGHCIIGDRTNVGMGACIHQRVEIPEGCMIGMGAVVPKGKRDANAVYVGNPARFLRWNRR